MVSYWYDGGIRLNGEGTIIDGNDIYGVSGDGTTSSLTGVLYTLASNETLTLEAIFTAGTQIEFFINGISKATKTTNLPTGTSTTAGYFQYYTVLSTS